MTHAFAHRRLKTNKGRTWIMLGLAFCLAFQAKAAIPAPEKILPDDTLLMLTVPDFARLRQIYEASPLSQFWNDPAMKSFKEKFLTRWKEEFVEPLERELNLRFDDYTNLPQGQVTFALTQNSSQSKDEQAEPAALLLLDTKDRSTQLKTNLAELRRKWTDSGRTIKIEKIRDVEFAVVQVSSNDIPKTLRKLFPPAPQMHELGEEQQPEKPAAKDEWVIGQFESLLILTTSTRLAEKIVSRLAGSAMPTLGELAGYDANHQALFRDAPAYGWVNMKTFVEMLARDQADKKSDVPDPFGMAKPDKILAATGFAALKTLAFNFRNSPEGVLVQFFVGAPEASRQGLFKIIAGEAKEYTPPPFIPADAVKFQRWRLDGQKAWSTLEKMLSDISPQMASSVNFLIDMANTVGKEKDPGFDVRKNLIGNLGDDMISYEKAPKSGAPPGSSGPSLFLLGSPNAEQLAASFNGIFAALNQGNSPNEREFLGRKILSIPMPSMPVPVPGLAGSATGKRATLSYAVSSGYLAISTDPSLLEEYLRSSESQGKALRETAGFVDATQKVTGPGTGLFGYENQAETMRTTFESLKKNPAAVGNSLDVLPTPFGLASAAKTVRGWMDFSLLPSFDRVSKYFYFTVYGGSATVDGLTLKVFAPAPPALKK